jgi:hypothetical protein
LTGFGLAEHRRRRNRLLYPRRGTRRSTGWSEGLWWPATTTAPYTLFLAPALAYVYVVTLLAWQMGGPHERVYPWVLTQAKAASAVICLGLFALQEQYLLYLANFVVDGAIAILVWWLCLRTAAGTATHPAVRAGDQTRLAGS